MNKLGLLMGVTVIALLAAGCSGSRDTRIVQQTTMYTTMDSTALVYTDPASASPIQDHPLRWGGFLFYPAGVAFDYLLNRPFYFVASLWPGLFGYTSEDTMVNAQRQSVFR